MLLCEFHFSLRYQIAPFLSLCFGLFSPPISSWFHCLSIVFALFPLIFYYSKTPLCQAHSQEQDVAPDSVSYSSWYFWVITCLTAFVCTPPRFCQWGTELHNVTIFLLWTHLNRRSSWLLVSRKHALSFIYFDVRTVISFPSFLSELWKLKYPPPKSINSF